MKLSKTKKLWIKISKISEDYNEISLKDAIEDLLKDNLEKFGFEIQVIEIKND